MYNRSSLLKNWNDNNHNGKTVTSTTIVPIVVWIAPCVPRVFKDKSKLSAQIRAQESVAEGLRAERKLWSQELAQQGEAPTSGPGTSAVWCLLYDLYNWERSNGKKLQAPFYLSGLSFVYDKLTRSVATVFYTGARFLHLRPVFSTRGPMPVFYVEALSCCGRQLLFACFDRSIAGSRPRPLGSADRVADWWSAGVQEAGPGRHQCPTAQRFFYLERHWLPY